MSLSRKTDADPPLGDAVDDRRHTRRGAQQSEARWLAPRAGLAPRDGLVRVVAP